eukprot:1921785-Pleurochrysis_carterae.AAC.1
MIRRPPRSTQGVSSAASRCVYETVSRVLPACLLPRAPRLPSPACSPLAFSLPPLLVCRQRHRGIRHLRESGWRIGWTRPSSAPPESANKSG